MGIYRTVGISMAWIFRIFILLLGGIYLYTGDVVAFILYLMVFILSLAPIMIEQIYNIRLHWTLTLIISFLLAMHMFGFFWGYAWISVYDDIAHIAGSAFLALVGFSLFYSMDYAGKIRMSLPTIGFVTFIWTMAFGAVWEIIEFTWDNIVVFSSQYGFSQNSLLDTMTDLSFDAIAGISIALLCVFLIRRASKQMLDGIFSPIKLMIQHKTQK